MGTISLTYSGGLTSMTLHDFIISIILPVGTLGYNIRYTSEYITKLQIHQQYCESMGTHYKMLLIGIPHLYHIL